MRTRAVFAFCSLLCSATGCGSASDDTARKAEGPEPVESAAEDAGAGKADAGSEAGAALPPAPPRYVAMELPPVVGRSVEVQDGTVVWGEVEPLDEVTSCIIERRDAYAVFQPYEPLDEPLCVTTSAEELAYFDQVPENSDLTITVSKPGYLPQVLSQRVETWDVRVHSDVRSFLVSVLLQEEQAQLLGARPLGDLGDTSADPDASGGRGQLLVQGWMVLLAEFPPSTESLFSSFRDPGVYPVEKSALTVSALQDDGAPDDPPVFDQLAELELDGAPLFMDVPATTYRTHLDHPRSSCEPMGLPYALFFSGLGTGMAGELEVRVLPGHVTSTTYACLCARTSQEAEVVNPGQCLFEEP